MFIDEEVYDALLGDLIQTIGQSLVCDRDSKQWLLRPSRFQVYGVNDSLMTASMELVTSHGSSIGTIQFNLASRIKVEKGEEFIIIPSDNSDGNLPTIAPPIRSPLIDSSLPNSIERTSTPISDPPPNIGHQQSLSVVDSLKKLQASKGAMNAFRNLDYGNLDIQKVQFLPPFLNGNVLFELPPLDMSALQSYTKLKHRMDKHHYNHAWTKTITSHIKNDMSLMFYTSICIGHFHCENQDCKYTFRIHCTSPMNVIE